jgi:hypothetical protein
MKAFAFTPPYETGRVFHKCCFMTLYERERRLESSSLLICPWENQSKHGINTCETPSC